MGLPAVFQRRDYALLWLGQLISNLGDAFYSLALAWLVKEMTGSGLLMGTVLACYTLPIVFVSPVAGVLSDRFDKRRLMIGTDLVRTALVTIVAVLFGLRLLTIGIVLVAAVLMGATAALFDPVRQGSLVFLVEKSELAQANALAMMTRQVSQLMGPVSAGLVVAQWGIGPAIWVDAASFAASAALLWLMRLRTNPTSGGSAQGVWCDLKVGLRTVSAHPVMKWIFPLRWSSTSYSRRRLSCCPSTQAC